MAYWQFGKITLLGAGMISPRTAKLKDVCKKSHCVQLAEVG